jgi:simple sugar transport system permease protein
VSVLNFLLQTLNIAVPLLLAAAGGVLSERAGVIALALEGFMLAGAFGAALGSYAAGSPWAGLLCGVAGGLAVAALHALAGVRLRADQVVTGVALNLLVVGATRFFLRYGFDSSSNSPRVPGFPAPLLNPVLWAAVLAPPALAWLLYRTPFGLRVRAVGEKPEAALSLGVRPARVQWAAVLGSGALAGLGGAHLALDQHQFVDGMTSGRGFIALAAVIFGRWDPVRVALACLGFAAVDALQIQIQALALVPSQFVAAIPYVLTIVALAGVVGRATPPAALGKAAA